MARSLQIWLIPNTFYHTIVQRQEGILWYYYYSNSCWNDLRLNRQHLWLCRFLNVENTPIPLIIDLNQVSTILDAAAGTLVWNRSRATACSSRTLTRCKPPYTHIRLRPYLREIPPTFIHWALKHPNISTWYHEALPRSYAWHFRHNKHEVISTCSYRGRLEKGAV